MAAIGAKTAFVFSGGGSLGAIQAGMLRVLLSYGLKPDFVVGASVGAINASYFASAPDAECVARLERDPVRAAARGHFSFYLDERLWPDQASRIHR
jgi:predicted acylesterase/phospholipase RssA